METRIATESDPTDLLDEVVKKKPGGFVELRFHKKRSRALAVEKGRVETAQVTEHTGVGVRVLEDGTWGSRAPTASSGPRSRAPSTKRGPRRARRRARGPRGRRPCPPRRWRAAV